MEEKPKQNQRQNDKNHKNKKYNNKGKKPQKPAYVPPYTAQELAMPIDVLELNEVTFKVLSDGGVDTIGKIVVRTAQEMYGVQRFNKKNLAELTVRLNAKGFDFKPSPAAVAQPKETENVAKTEPKSEKKEPRAKPEAKEKNKQRQEPQVVKAKPKDEEPSFDKKSVDNGKKSKDNSFDVYKIFPRKPFVPSPPVKPKEDRFVKFQRGGKWGFKLAFNGKEIIPPIYDEVFNFKEDMACVERNQAFGFINRDNELVIPYKYDCALSFSEGLACVTIGEKSGYIDKQGNVVIPLVYDNATPFVDKVARVKQGGKWGTFSLETMSVDWNN